MRIVKEIVSFDDEIVPTYEQENRGFEGYAVGLDYLSAANTRCPGEWALALISKTDIANVMLPLHRLGDLFRAADRPLGGVGVALGVGVVFEVVFDLVIPAHSTECVGHLSLNTSTLQTLNPSGLHYFKTLKP